MDYTGLLTKAWNTIWNNKFLMVLGILAAFGRGGGNAGAGNRFNLDNSGGGPSGTPTPGDFFSPDIQRQLTRGFDEMTPVVIAIVAAVVCFFLLLGLAVWVFNRTAQGGLINGVNTIDGGGVSSFSVAFRAGWSKIRRLLLIEFVAALPAILLSMVIAVMIVGYLSTGQGEVLRDALQGGNVDRAIRAILTNTGFLLGILAVFCPLVIISLIAQAVAQFADRACVLENKGLVESYQRGFQVLRDHLGNAVALYILQIVISALVGFVLIIPAFCCLLWPVFIVIAGVAEAYFSTIWTMAWRQWTGALPASGEPIPAPSA